MSAKTIDVIVYARAWMHEILQAWHGVTARYVPEGAAIWDGHTHTGWNDPDGRDMRAADLLAALDGAGHSGAVVFSNQDPIGYRTANDRVLREAEAAEGRLIPFLRVDPSEDEARHETRRSIERGHRGIKLHPRAEQFSLSDRGVHQLAEIAVANKVPFLVHAGRGIDSLADDAVALLDAHPGLRVIFAHGAISDLPRLSSSAAHHAGIYFDTAWWAPVDLGALFAWVPVSRILYASDTPYGNPVMSSIVTVRAAVEAGVKGAQLAEVLGGNLHAVLDGTPPDDTRKGHRPALDLWTSRVLSYTLGAIACRFSGADDSEPMELAIRACEAPESDYPAVLAAIKVTLEAAREAPDRAGTDLRIVAASACATPRVDVPELA